MTWERNVSAMHEAQRAQMMDKSAVRDDLKKFLFEDNLLTKEEFASISGVPRNTLNSILYREWQPMILRSTEKKIRKAMEEFDPRTDRKRLPIGPFSEMLKRIKKERDLTIPQIAEICGYTDSRITSYIYPHKRKTVNIEDAIHIVKRLHGKPTPPTPLEKKKISKAMQARRELGWIEA